MMNLRSVAALLSISSLLACATAINDDGSGLGSLMAAGSDSGGSGSVEEGGAPAAGGAPARAGAPASAAGRGSGSGSAGKGAGGTGTGAGGRGGGAAGRGGGTAGRGGIGAAGTGTGTGGRTGTGSAGGSAAGAPGSAGGTGIAPCDNAKDIPATASNTGELGTVGAACYRTKAKFNALTCSSFDGRTLKVNGVISKCDGVATFAPAIDGWNYFDISEGKFTYAQMGWFCTLASC